MTIQQPTLQQPTHLSDQAAERIFRNAVDAELAAFVAALTMQRPVTAARAAQLLEHVIRETMSATTALLEDQMRLDHWQAELAAGETLAQLAERAQHFLETPDGVRLYNFFAKTLARTSGEMFG
ncbi:MAG: hypothetical protein QFF03_03865 [Pseudomonadota bacterium]|nr:hypothetical protein [Pseudomonadota bacterium]